MRMLPVDCAAGAVAGNVNRTVVPSPAALMMSMSAPWRWAMPYTMARPRPEPRSPLVVKNGSRQRRRVASSMPAPVSLTSMNTRREMPLPASSACPVRSVSCAAFGHGIGGVEAQIDQGLAQLTLDGHHGRIRVALDPASR